MKRGFVNSRQFYASLENSKVKDKYRNLLEDYLELQKEYVSKKKKLEIEKQKREILLDEVRFLRQRHNYLTKSPLTKVGPEIGIYQNVDLNDPPLRKDRNHTVNEIGKLKLIPLTQSVIEHEETGREKLALMKPCIKKKPKNCLINDNKSGKRKISWQDKVALEV
ncbi:ribosomal RNA small subunit methyltransferase G [Senna tora]|uniref:Ribosomal RNA small subunit methyltransferase G n=1 Tax=Senna tora TaxID=362788 RepID=A0A834TYH6_9FABA|nr:ribosomal RNA small subunit methyltransferase G [Senna tora]